MHRCLLHIKGKSCDLRKNGLAEEDIFPKCIDIAFADMTDFVAFGNEEIEYTTDSDETRNGKPIKAF